MRYHTSTTQYHCGINLHSTQMYVCVMDTSGKVLLHMNIRGNDFEFFLHKIAPWRHDMTVTCEAYLRWAFGEAAVLAKRQPGISTANQPDCPNSHVVQQPHPTTHH